MEGHIQKLLPIINAIVNDGSLPWTEKRDEILRIARDEGDETNLLEFISWFEGVND